MIYISLYERMVRVVGDDAISEKLGQEDWEDVCQSVLSGMKSGNAATALNEAILKCGVLLSQHFPNDPDDQNELANELKIID